MKSFSDVLETLKEDTQATRQEAPPPTILFRRKAIRMYPEGKKVALYYSEKVDKYVSIPFEGSFTDDHKDKNVITTESVDHKALYHHHINQFNYHDKLANDAYKKDKATYIHHTKLAGDHEEEARKHYDAWHLSKNRREMDNINEETKPKAKPKAKVDGKDAEEPEDHIMLMHKIVARKRPTRINFKNGSGMLVDAPTASVILNVHNALKKKENQEQMAKNLAHSKARFLNIANFCHGVHSQIKPTTGKK